MIVMHIKSACVKHGLLYVLTILSFSVAAQKTKHIKKRDINLAIKWTPLNLVDFYPTFQLGLEQRISKKISIQYEVAPVFTNKKLNTFSDVDNSNYRGFKTKFEVRRYYRKTSHWYFYYASQLYYNHINYTKAETFAVYPDPADPNRYDLNRQTYGIKYSEEGVTLKAGFLLPFYRFCLDLHAGISGRLIHYATVNKPTPPDYNALPPPSLNEAIIPDVGPIERSRTALSPSLGIRLGYIIK